MKFRCWILLCCLLLTVMGGTAFAQGEAVLSLSADQTSGYGGDEITLSLLLDAQHLGGLQTNITWNTGCLTYVKGSAAFSAAFTENAAVHMVNDDEDGVLRLAYGHTGGYTAGGEAIFTARFRLKEGVSGETVFTLTETKATDASASLAAMQVTTGEPLAVQTMIYQPGSVYLYPMFSDSSPAVGTTVELTVAASTVDTLGSLQGLLRYNPNVLRYVTGSAAFTQAYADAGFTMMINADTPGEVSFVYASISGCSYGEVLKMQFEVIGGVNEYAEASLANVKATNASSTHLAMMDVSCGADWLYPQPRPDAVYYTATFQQAQALCNETVTLSLRADGAMFGGAQGVITYDASKLIYVDGTAAFSSSFAKGANVALINTATEGKIQFVSVHAEGYTPTGEDILTAQFSIRVGAESVQLSALKTSSAGDAPTVIDSVVQPGSIPMVAHDETVIPGYAPTCTLPGMTDGLYCAGCSTTLTVQEAISATGHSVITLPYAAPTCTETGLTAGEQCTACSQVLTPQETIPATGHTETAVPGYAATCTLSGLTDGLACAVCGHVFTAQQVIPATGHAEIDDPAVPATHITTGLTAGVHCGTCSEILTAQQVLPTATVDIIALPAQVRSIAARAFEGCDFLCVVVPDTCHAIAERAFAGCDQLLFAEIPASVTEIDPSAFADCSSELIIVTTPGSRAHTFAQENSLRVVLLNK